MHQQLIRRLKGMPAVVRRGDDDVLSVGNRTEHPEGVEGILIVVVDAREGDFIVALVAAIVADCNLERGIKLGHIQRNGSGFAVHARLLGRHRNVLIATAGLGQSHNRSDIIVVRNRKPQQAGIGLLAVEVVQAGQIQGGGLGINDHFCLNDIVHLIVPIVQVGADVQLHPIQIFHRIGSIRILKVILFADLSVNQGRNQIVCRIIIVLQGVVIRRMEERIALCILPCKIDQLGIAHHAQVDLAELIQITVAVGAQHIVLRVIGLQNVGVQAQIVIRGAKVCKEDVDIPVGQRIDLIIPCAVKDRWLAPVAVEAQERQALSRRRHGQSRPHKCRWGSSHPCTPCLRW